jgi:hypothetical protein
MRQTAVVLILFTVTLGVSSAGGQTSDTARIQQWIDQLGRPKYADREKASQQLEAIGLAALEPLRLAAKSSDMEVRRRAEMLVRKLDDRQRTAALLAPKRVHLNVQDVTVAEAVAQLSALSGYPIQLQGNASILTARRVTLDTGDSTFWEAARQLCDKAGLVDTADVTTATRNLGGARPMVGKVGAQKLTRPNLSGGLQWTIGDPALRPTCSTGSVRVQVINVFVSQHGEIDVVLEVTGEPRLTEFGAVGTATVDKALDDCGQNLTIATGAPKMGSDDIEARVANVVIVNGNVMMGGPGTPRQVVVRLLASEKKSAKLQELTGKLAVQALVDDEPLLVVDKILEAGGKSVRGKDGVTLDIQKIVKMPNDDLRIVVAMDRLPGLNNMMFGGGNIRIQARNALMGNEPPAPGFQYPRLFDAAGKSFTLVQASTPSLMINGNNVSVTADLLYRPQAGQGPAAKLVLPGQSHFVFEVPFALKDIRLP